MEPRKSATTPIGTTQSRLGAPTLNILNVKPPTQPSAQDLKAKGNEAFKSGDYPAAIGHYSAAVIADRTDPTFPLNRAAAYLKLGKYEDTIRDCTTVLSLDTNNVKALFRRGQALVGLGRLSEAQQDFNEVLRLDPTNQAAKQESVNVSGMIQKAPSKGRNDQPTLTSTRPKRRRIPIEIVDSATPTPTTPKPENLPTVSTPSPPRAFKDAQKARMDAKPSLVGGGIFRSTGEHTILRSPAGNGSVASPVAPPSKPCQDPETRPNTVIPPDASTNVISITEPPKTLFEFTKALRSTSSTNETWDVVCTIPPPKFPSLFQTSLEPSVLALLLQIFLAVLDQQPDSRNLVREYMEVLSAIPRFNTVSLLLTSSEKEWARKIWEKLGVVPTWQM